MSYKQDIQTLRGLARKYAEIAQDDSNGKLRILHRAVNDLQMIRPVVLIDDLPWGELNTNGELTLQCQDPDFRTAETYMRQTLYRFYHFRADMIVRPYIPVEKIIYSTGYGVEIIEDTLQHNGDTHIVSHEYQDQFADCEGLEKLHKCVITYDEEATNQIYYKIADAIGDIIPVKKTGQNYLSAVTWDNIAEYRGVEPLLMDLIAEPEFSHALVKKMSELVRDRNEQFLKLGLYDTDPEHLHNTSTLCSALHPELDNTDYKNIWGRGAAQVFSSVSKQMHDEFDITYMIDTIGQCGLVYYGCCEPLDKKIDIVEKIPNLRKISITPWADVNVAAQAIGKKYVMAAKPNPAAVGMGTLNKEELRKEVLGIVDACYKNGCAFDFALKDISTVGHNPNVVTEWEEIVMDIITHY